MSPKNILVLLLPFLLVASSLSILPSSSPANDDSTPHSHSPKPPSPHIENSHPKPPYHGKPPSHMKDVSYKPSHDDDKPLHIKDTLYDRLPSDRSVKPPSGDPTHPDGKPPHKPPHHGKPPPIGTTKELPPKEQQGAKIPHPRPGHGGHNIESSNFRPIDPPGSD